MYGREKSCFIFYLFYSNMSSYVTQFIAKSWAFKLRFIQILGEIMDDQDLRGRLHFLEKQLEDQNDEIMCL